MDQFEAVDPTAHEAGARRLGAPTVVIVGAGIVGAFCAYYVARAGGRPIMIDRLGVGEATSAASGSAVMFQTKSNDTMLSLTGQSMALYDGAAADTGIPYRRDGSLVLFREGLEEEYVGKRVEWLSSQGILVEMLNREALLRRCPDIGPEVVGASYSPLDAEVAAAPAAVGVTRRAVELGAEVITDREVTGFMLTGDRVTGVRTTRGEVPGDFVVVAAGPWSRELLGHVGVDLPVRIQKGEQLLTLPTAPRLRGRILSAGYLLRKYEQATTEDGFAMGLAAGQEPDGRIRLGSTREWSSFDTSRTARGRQALLDEVGIYLPPLARLPIARHTVGFRAVSDLGHPVVSQVPGVRGLSVAAGHGGDGVALAPLSGWAVSRHAFGESTPWDDILGFA